MGRKKKKSGSAQKSKPRPASKDSSSHAGDDPDLLSEELTALSAIFHDDLKIVFESPHTQFTITLRPYSNDMGAGESNVSAVLLVRCLPGYPHKYPKLRIVSEKGLTKKDVDRLLSLLLDQATINAREGRAMIFNLVEAAQEFLSEIVPVEEHVPVVGLDRKDQLLQDNASVPYTSHFSEESFVYGTVDLYHDLCGADASWGGCGANVEDNNYNKLSRDHTLFIDDTRSKNILLHSAAANIQNGSTDDRLHQITTPKMVHATKPGLIPRASSKLDLLEEEAESSIKSLSPSPSGVQFAIDSSENGSGSGCLEELNLGEKKIEADGNDSESTSLASFVSINNESQTKNKDLLMVYLLHLACSSKGSIAHTLSEISSELHNLGSGQEIWLLNHCQCFAKFLMMLLEITWNTSRKQKQKPIGVNLRTRTMSYLWYVCFAYVVLLKDQQFMLCPSYYQNHTILGFSERASELAVLLPSEFNEVFDGTFGHHTGGIEADCCNCPAETAFNSNLSEGGSMGYPNSPVADDN